MTSSTIYLPAKVKVGFQKRNDTYTKKLAYLIYYDAKNKLRKETSWEGWRDNEISAEEYDNEPTEGFVLNKKVGGDSNGWNHRQTYTRVYDPRGFEFEITVPNLLYILENTSSVKGKGLEGKFVYGWDGTELVLIPEQAPEYQQLRDYSTLLETAKSVKTSELVLGGTYRTPKNVDYIYLGRFDLYDQDYNYNYSGYTTVNKGKRFYFKEANEKRTWRYYTTMKSISGRFIQITSSEPVENYADLMSDLESSTYYSPYDKSKDKYFPVDKKFVKDLKDQDYYGSWSLVYFTLDGIAVTARLAKTKDGNYLLYAFDRAVSIRTDYWNQDDWKRQQEARLRVAPGWGSKEGGLPLEELVQLYGLTYKQEYLANGKKKH